MRSNPGRFVGAIVTVLLAVGTVACDQPEMANQPKYEPYEAAAPWPDNQSARQPPTGTVALGATLRAPAERMPVPVNRTLLERGRAHFNTFCLPCHGRVGYGEGMVVQRGYPPPPSFHSRRLREAPLRHFYTVISEGYGVMYSYGDRVPPPARWAIAAYIRALQASQHTAVSRLTPAQRARLDRKAPGS